MKPKILLAFAILLTPIIGISQTKSSQLESLRLKNQYAALKDIEEGSALIRNKARAVFQLQNGTGSVVEWQGQKFVMTNAHILGSQNCGLSGCQVSAHIESPGSAYGKKRVKVFLVPVAESISADVTFFRIRKNSVLSKITPLTFANVEDQHLMGASVTSIGFPQIARKKWSTGSVVARSGGWMRASYFSLPGSSGSPVVNEAGDIVGIHHRAKPKLAIMTNEGFLYSGIFTPLSKIKKVLERFLKGDQNVEDFYPNLTQQVSLGEALKKSAAYMNAGFHPQLENGQEFATALPIHCQKSLDLKTTSFAKFDRSTKPCLALARWINCRSKKSLNLCPHKKIRKSIEQTFKSIVAKRMEFESFPVAPFLSGLSKLYKSRRKGHQVALHTMKNAVTPESLKGHFILIRTLIRYAKSPADLVVDDVDVAQLVRDFRGQSGYAYQLVDIIESLKLMHRKKFLSKSQFNKIMRTIARERHLTVGARLALDR